MTTCPTCEGLRIVTVTVPNMKGPSNNRYQSNNPPFVGRNYQCPGCHGTGTVECAHCLDTGEYPLADTYGDYAGTMHCSCEAGQAKLSADECDAMYAHAAFSGHTPANPPLSDEPF